MMDVESDVEDVSKRLEGVAQVGGTLNNVRKGRGGCRKCLGRFNVKMIFGEEDECESDEDVVSENLVCTLFGMLKRRFVMIKSENKN